MDRKKRIRIQTLGLIICTVFALATVFIFALGKANIKPSSDTDIIDQNPMASEEVTGYEPANDVVINGEKESSAPFTDYSYAEEVVKFSTLADAEAQGYKLTSDDYDENCKIVLTKGSDVFSKDYSQTTRKVNKAVTEEGAKGGYVSKNVTETEDAPLLEPYYGYIIYTAQGKKQLLDSKGNVLLSSIGGYEPAYAVTMFGEPLFIKGDKYYYFYNSSIKDAVFYDDVTDESFASLPETQPTAYPYLDYDLYITSNYLFSGSAELPPVTEISPEKPKGAAMVEYSLDKQTLYTIGTAAYTYKESSVGLYPFYSYQYDPEFNIEKTLWGYMDKKGEVVIEPQFSQAYQFSEEGYAVVEDIHGHLCIINTKGSVVYNPYDPPLFIPEMGNKKIRNIFVLPDTYGKENTGMLLFDHGYTLMRRQLVDTESGYMIRRETKVVVSPSGEYVNYPADCTLLAYSSGMLLLEKDGLYGYMNYMGEWVVEPVYKYAEPFSEGLAVVSYGNGKMGMIDTNANIVLPFIYTKISACSGGIIAAWEENNGWTLYNKVSSVTEEKKDDEMHPLMMIKYRAIAEAKHNNAIRQEEEAAKKEEQQKSKDPAANDTTVQPKDQT